MGGTKFNEVGGGPATGLANDFVSLLRGSLFGNFGGQPTAGQRFDAANPVGSTQGIAGFLQNILGEGAGNLGGSLRDLITQQQTRDVGDIRSRFGASGGQAFGTPAAYGEARYRAEAAPQAAVATGGLQMNVIQQLLQQLGVLSGKGISQRQTVAQPSGITSLLGTIAPALGAFAAGPGGAAFGKLFSGGIPSFKDLGIEIPDISSIPTPAFSF